MQIVQTASLILCIVLFAVCGSSRGEDENSTPVRSAADQRTFQHARLISGLGRVDFEISSKNALARIYFNQGVALLYHRDERQAERAFLQMTLLDPECAIAHWGLAMANRRSPDEAATHIEKAVEIGEAQQVPTIERYLINSLAIALYEESTESESTGSQPPLKLKRNLRRNSELQALQLWHMLDDKSRTGADVDWGRAQKLLTSILQKNPAHPIQVEWLARYRPDDPDELPAVAKKACDVMPHAPRTWRESGGVFARAGRHADAVLCYEKAMRLEHNRMREDRLLPEQIPGHAATQKGLIISLTRLGRIREALALANTMVTTPCLSPRSSSIPLDSICVSAQRTVLDLLSRYELWDETIELAKSPIWNAFCSELDLEKRTVLGAAHFFTGDAARGREQVAELKRLWLKTVVAPKNRSEETSARSPAVLRQRLTARLTDSDSVLRRIEATMNRLSIYEAFASNDVPRLRELLDGEPDLPATHLARMYQAIGNARKAKSLVFDVRPESPHRVLDLAHQVSVLQAADEVGTTQALVDELHRTSSVFDRDLPMICRVSATLTTDSANAVPRRIGQRAFEDLPRHGYTAPGLTLPDRHGELVSLDDHPGRPVLIVFYLGAGCPHCIEQLQALAPMHKDFVEAGIKVIAVSTDTIPGLQETYEVADIDGEGDKTLPFTLVSDSSLDRFRAFRAFDEFSDKPIHGAFLLDGERRVLWQNTGKQPFMQIEFLLEEAKRLLSYSDGNAESTDHAATAKATFN